jgi:hypothetical protein
VVLPCIGEIHEDSEQDDKADMRFVVHIHLLELTSAATNTLSRRRMGVGWDAWFGYLSLWQ